jgi:hypothetical protein
MPSTFRSKTIRCSGVKVVSLLGKTVLMRSAMMRASGGGFSLEHRSAGTFQRKIKRQRRYPGSKAESRIVARFSKLFEPDLIYMK